MTENFLSEHLLDRIETGIKVDFGAVTAKYPGFLLHSDSSGPDRTYESIKSTATLIIYKFVGIYSKR